MRLGCSVGVKCCTGPPPPLTPQVQSIPTAEALGMSQDAYGIVEDILARLVASDGCGNVEGHLFLRMFSSLLAPLHPRQWADVGEV